MELKPCPFCGGTDLENYGEYVPEADVADFDGDAWVECNECGAQGPATRVGCRDPEEDPIDLEKEAADAWNQRSGS